MFPERPFYRIYFRKNREQLEKKLGRLAETAVYRNADGSACRPYLGRCAL
jgi:hypothetical protein